jgi:hypothetical protein
MSGDRKYKIKSYTQKYRNFPIDLTETGTWEKLNLYSRLIFFAMWNSVKTNTAGIFRGSINAVKTATGIRVNSSVKEGVKELEGVGWIVPCEEGGWYIPEWFRSNATSQEFVDSAIREIGKFYPSQLERFAFDHKRRLNKHGVHLLPKPYANQQSDVQGSVNRYAVAVTEVNTPRGNQPECLQKVAQRLKHKIEPGRHEEFDRIITLFAEGRIDYEEGLKRLSPFGLTGIEHEEILCALPDNGLIN